MSALAINPRARFDFELLEHLEGGLVLTGAEVKSAKLGHAQLKGAFLTIESGNLVLKHAHIGLYAPAGAQDGYDSRRGRRVLVHKKELRRLMSKHETERLTMVPVQMYVKKGLVKLEFALARGKKRHDKKEALKKRDLDRQMHRNAFEA